MTLKGERYVAAHSLPRGVIEAEIEILIAALDAYDGDENLEPYLAGFDGGPKDDREGDDSDLELCVTDLEQDVLDQPHDEEMGI